MLLTVFLLATYFLAVTGVLAFALVPAFRAMTCSRLRTLSDKWKLGRQSLRHKKRNGAHFFAYKTSVWSQEVRTLTRKHAMEVAVVALLLTVVPLSALVWRHWNRLETFDHTDTHVTDERVAALLAGERLTPPAPLPPEVFLTREVASVLPLARFASRDWMLLDEEFRQRVLMLYRIMRDQHGYDVVLLEGYRSAERQAQLASLGTHVTQAGPGRSYHQHGLAADSAFLRDGKVVISERDPCVLV
jgi:peptidoglycan L-alanyl-D-glutamate endopeptidase CwlK